jgi:hypothetical protein
MVFISSQVPDIEAEEALDDRRAQVWNTGLPVEGIITKKIRTKIGRKTVFYRYEWNEQPYISERVIPHVDDFAALSFDSPLPLRIDPKEPAFSVITLDVAPTFTRWMPSELLTIFVLALGALIALYGHWRLRILRSGLEVPCTLEPTHNPKEVRATYTFRGTMRTRKVEGRCDSPGEAGILLLDPTFPSRPLLGTHARFQGKDEPEPISVDELHRRWKQGMLPGVIGGWIGWVALWLVTGESLSYIHVLFSVVVGITFLLIGSSASKTEGP